MPCPHNEITIVQRSQRQSAVAAAAYQSGEKLFCEYDQQVKGFTTSQPLFLTRSRGIWCSLRVHTTPPAFPMWGFMWARTGTEAPSCCIVATLSSIQSWTPAIGNPTFTPTGG